MATMLKILGVKSLRQHFLNARCILGSDSFLWQCVIQVFTKETIKTGIWNSFSLMFTNIEKSCQQRVLLWLL